MRYFRRYYPRYYFGRYDRHLVSSKVLISEKILSKFLHGIKCFENIISDFETAVSKRGFLVAHKLLLIRNGEKGDRGTNFASGFNFKNL